MYKSAAVIFCGLSLLAGCTTTPDEPPPAVWSAAGPVSKPVSVEMNRPAPPVIHTNLPAATNTNGVAANTNLARPTLPPVVTWTALNRWASAQKIGLPHKISDSPLTTYALGSSNGVMILAIGSHGALWNGTEINLAFEPQIIDGEVFLHGLDLQKNLEPLLCAPRLELGTNRVIVLDPGHGGTEPGARSALGDRYEKQFTLDWARRLKPLLETGGWQVFLTRTDDTDMALSNRVTFAEAHHASLFISLHFNSASPNPKPAGMESYCLTPTGMPSTLTRGYPDIWTQNYPNNSFDTQNVQLAMRLQRSISRTTGLEDRGVNHARFIGVLRGQKRPAVLLEGGYLSNPSEARHIEDPAFRQQLAEAVAAALR